MCATTTNHMLRDALSVVTSRTSALTANFPVCRSELTTDVPCLLVACTTTTTGLPLAMRAR